MTGAAPRRWLVTGARGQLGQDVCAALAQHGCSVTALGRADLDISDLRAVAAAVADARPDVIINAAAYTAVDAAETDEPAAYAVNAVGPAALATAAADTGARLIHVSTDYVFAGDASAPYDVDDLPAPKSVYGRTKLDGERAVREVLPNASYIVRTAWVYGAVGSNFVKTMMRLEAERETVDVVDDQVGAPTWSSDLAGALIELGDSGAPAGIYHCTNDGSTSWFGFTRAIFEELGADPDRVHPTTTAKFPRPAPRPAYSVLSNRSWRAAGLRPLRPWREALVAALPKIRTS
ncbi:MAG: dTDP-4-dehydrorhamnose reductase [Actinobacteria bacterium]|nr:dTDP-4-dehydrorhamnose reductase [Actinomycetota bacterium]